jgi:hypothetical protein
MGAISTLTNKEIDSEFNFPQLLWSVGAQQTLSLGTLSSESICHFFAQYGMTSLLTFKKHASI